MRSHGSAVLIASTKPRARSARMRRKACRCKPVVLGAGKKSLKAQEFKVVKVILSLKAARATLSHKNKQLKGYTVRLTACFMAGIGPTPITEGSTPACDQETICANGLSIRLSAFVFFMRTTAAAPSFIPVNKWPGFYSAP